MGKKETENHTGNKREKIRPLKYQTRTERSYTEIKEHLVELIKENAIEQNINNYKDIQIHQ